MAAMTAEADPFSRRIASRNVLAGSEAPVAPDLAVREELERAVATVIQGDSVVAYFLIRCPAFGRETGVKAASLSAASLAKRRSRNRAVFATIASYSRSCSHLKLASRFFDRFNSASAFRRGADTGEEFLLFSALPEPLRHRFNG